MNEQIVEVAKTAARVFVGTVLAAFIADITNLMEFQWADWQPVIYAAVAAVGVVVLNAINWKDARYGIGAE